MNQTCFGNKNYLILGGSSGIGFATAQALLAQGASVSIVGRDEEKLKSAQLLLGAPVLSSVFDIADEAAVQHFFKGSSFYDGIVCTAGETPPGSLEHMDSTSALRGFHSKFFGQYFVVKYGHKKLKAEGSIVLTGGVYSVRPRKDVGVLAAVNGAIESFVRAMALELAPLRINALAPGFIDTPRLKKVSRQNEEVFLARLKEQVPLKRVGEPKEAAQSMLYLLSSSYTTGSTLFLDGGITLR